MNKSALVLIAFISIQIPKISVAQGQKNAINKSMDSSLYNTTDNAMHILIIKQSFCNKNGKKMILVSQKITEYDIPPQSKIPVNLMQDPKEKNCEQKTLVHITKHGKVVFEQSYIHTGNYHIFFNNKTKQYEFIQVIA